MRERVTSTLRLLPKLLHLKMLIWLILILEVVLLIGHKNKTIHITQIPRKEVAGVSIAPTMTTVQVSPEISIFPTTPPLTPTPFLTVTIRPQSNIAQTFSPTKSPTPSPTVTPSVSQPTGHLTMKGSSSAKVTIVEYSDFQCPYCKMFFDNTLCQIESEYINSGKVKFAYRQFPLSAHANAQKAAMASECANEQGKFWDMHNKLFQDQSSWSGNTNPTGDFSSYASNLGMNVSQFSSCLSDNKFQGNISDDMSSGSSLGVSATPTFYINNAQIVGAQPFSQFKTLIDQELAKM